MKIRITMKDPDGFTDSVAEALEAQMVDDLPEEEMDALRDIRRDEIKRSLKRWFEYDEYIRVEVDTAAQTCVVLPVKG
jgi:hypothetical protein